MKKGSIIILLCVSFIMGAEFGKWVNRYRAYIPDWYSRIPYDQFFREERKTDSPIKNSYIKNWCLFVETVDGNKDIIPLEIKYK